MSGEKSKIAKEKKRWEEEKVNKSLDKFPERKKKFLTTSDIEFKRIFTEADIDNIDYLKDIGFPGEYPFYPGSTAHRLSGKILDYEAVCRFCHCRRDQQSLQVSLGTGPDRFERGI